MFQTMAEGSQRAESLINRQPLCEMHCDEIANKEGIKRGWECYKDIVK